MTAWYIPPSSVGEAKSTANSYLLTSFVLFIAVLNFPADVKPIVTTDTPTAVAPVIRSILPMLVTIKETAIFVLIPVHPISFMVPAEIVCPILLSLSVRLSTTFPFIILMTNTSTSSPIKAAGINAVRTSGINEK